MARIIVFGGTGYAGSAIVKEASSRGHAVTSISRSQPMLPDERVIYRVSPAEDATDAIRGADVVVAALSPEGDNAGRLLGIYRGLASKAADANARFVVIGGFSSLRPSPGAPRFAEGADIPEEYRRSVQEMYAICRALEAGDLPTDWLLATPAAEFGAFAPGETLGRYRVSGDVALFDENGKSAISGPDFARAVIDEIEHPTRHRAQIHFAY